MALVEELNDENEDLRTIEDVQKIIKEKLDIEIKKPKLGEILRKEVGMWYRRIEATSWKANAPKNLILRQHFA